MCKKGCESQCKHLALTGDAEAVDWSHLLADEDLYIAAAAGVRAALHVQLPLSCVKATSLTTSLFSLVNETHNVNRQLAIVNAGPAIIRHACQHAVCVASLKCDAQVTPTAISAGRQRQKCLGCSIVQWICCE